METIELNHWQRQNMRGYARGFVHAYPVPSEIAGAITHRELSFTSRPIHERLQRIDAAVSRAMAKHFPHLA